MASSFRAGGGQAPHHAPQAEALLNNPKFFCEFNDLPPQLAFSSEKQFHFSSPISSRWAQNNRVTGKLYRAGRDWRSRPSVILLHGWSAELQYRWQFPLLATRLARKGINAAIFELPYHGQRRPTEPGAIQNFISYDLLQMLQATQQALADTRALSAWLAAQGSPSIGLWGISLGAWLAGLLICTHKAAAEYAVLLTPVARVDKAIQELAFCESIRCSLQGAAPVQLEPLNLSSHSPLIARENILIAESRHDVFAPVETIEHLWHSWGQPEIWRLPHGHITVLVSPFIMNRIVKWIRKKAYEINGQLRHCPH
jgi:hypothetical protein